MTREEAIKLLSNERCGWCAFFDEEEQKCLKGNGCYEATMMAVQALQEPERKKGRWKADGIAIVCDQCGKGLVVEQGDADMNFCPNCGADMRGDKDDRREEAD